MDVKKPRGRASSRIHLWCRKHCSTSNSLETSPTNTRHTCLTTDLGIRFRYGVEPRLPHHHRRWHGLRWWYESICPCWGITMRARGATYVGSNRREVRVIYGEWNRWWDRGWLIIWGVGSGIIRRRPCPWYIIGRSTGAEAASCSG